MQPPERNLRQLLDITLGGRKNRYWLSTPLMDMYRLPRLIHGIIRGRNGRASCRSSGIDLAMDQLLLEMVHWESLLML